ncbi:hypothetical protein ACWCPI_37370 [Streptomyces sp. NPDC001920]
MRSKLLAAALGVATLLALSLTGTAQADNSDTGRTAATTAAASEIDYAVAGSPPSDRICTSAQGSTGCFRKYGDQWWVLDTDSPYAAIVNWENQLWDGASWRSYRNGNCENLLGEGNWGVCNKDYYENSSLNAYGSYGSRLRWRACGVFGCSSWTSWTLNNG